ncbi:MAG: hypothetical protein ACYSSO_08015 [Planctomycetota bacterium]|jgi:hypothetical protein
MYGLFAEIGGKMDGHNQVEPVCKFGPGGDFVSFWPDEPTDVQSAAEAVPARKESIRYPFSSATGKSGSDICSQATLFEDYPIGQQAGHKHKQRIRIYRRTTNKRPALNPAGQGTLFEADFKGAKTA